MFSGMDGRVVNALVKVGLFHAVSVFFHQTESSFDSGAERVQFLGVFLGCYTATLRCLVFLQDIYTLLCEVYLRLCARASSRRFVTWTSTRSTWALTDPWLRPRSIHARSAARDGSSI